MPLRYEVIRRLGLPSGATLPSLLSLPWLWGSPALSSPVDRPRGEVRSPPPQLQDNLGSAEAPATATGQSGKQILCPQAGHLAAAQLIS